MHQNAIKSLKLLTFSAFFFCKISVFFFAFFSVFFTFFLVKKVRMIVWSKRHVTETINSVAIWKKSQENVHLWTPSGWLFYQGGGTTWTLENASAQNAKNAKKHKHTQKNASCMNISSGAPLGCALFCHGGHSDWLGGWPTPQSHCCAPLPPSKVPTQRPPQFSAKIQRGPPLKLGKCPKIGGSIFFGQL